MKRLILMAAVAALALPAAATAQNDAAAIEKALAPLAARAAEGAAVIRWNADHSYVTLKEGTNTWVCYDRSADPGRAAFDVQCTSKANLERVKQNRMFAAMAADRDAENALIAKADADGTRVLPEYGSMWIAMRGSDQASAGIHTTVAVPGATTASTGLPDNGRAGGIYIMGAGTSTAHLMIPGR
jgi:hypothetical protein